jgi:nucleotide-binding universal stress UspA family protein
MIGKIMVPLDGSRFAEAALPAAMQLAKRDGAALQLAIVWEPLAPFLDVGDALRGTEEELEERWREELRRYMSDVARRIGEATNRTVSIKYLLGRPEEQLAKWAASSNTDLIVMATHGSGPISRVVLGSVADRLVRRSTVPVLLIRPQENLPEVQLAPAEPFRKILIPLDSSPEAEFALSKSLLLGAGPRSTEITLLRVVGLPTPLVATPEGVMLPQAPEILEAQREAAGEYLATAAARLEPWGCKVNTRIVSDPISWKAIVELASKEEYDLIAMATLGLGGVARVLLGSVANKVMRSSSVPTLLFHPEPARHGEGFQEKLAAEVLVEWP